MFNLLSNYSKRQILTTVILVILMLAIPVSVFLVQKTQILKSKAQADNPVSNAFFIKGENGVDLNCDTNTPNADLNCNTTTLNVTLRVKNLNALVK